MSIIKNFLHTFFFTIFYWDVIKFKRKPYTTYDIWRDRGYFMLCVIFIFLLLEPIKFIFYILYVISGANLSSQDASLYNIIVFPSVILSMIYFSIRLKREGYIEAIIDEIKSTEKKLIAERYRYTLFTVVIPAFLSPLVFLFIRMFIKHILLDF